MTGIFIVAFYTLFWGGCWLLSGIFNYQKAKNPLRRRKWVCFWFLMTPMYFHAFEYAFLLNECRNSPVYFPEEKIEKPNSLITNYRGFKNAGEQYEIPGKFEYLISPLKISAFKDDGSGIDPVDLSIGYHQYAKYAVYKQALEKSKSNKNIVLGEERLEILKNAKFALYEKSHKKWGFIYSHTYIYDYSLDKKIAAFTRVFQSISESSIRNFLTIIRMPKCTYNHGKYEYQDLSTKLLLKNTFIKDEK